MPGVWCEKTEGGNNESVAGEREREDKHFPRIHWRDVISKAKICVSHLVIEKSRKLCQHAVFNNASVHAVATSLTIQEEISVESQLFVYILHNFHSDAIHLFLLSSLSKKCWQAKTTDLNTLSELNRASHLKGGVVSIQC